MWPHAYALDLDLGWDVQEEEAMRAQKHLAAAQQAAESSLQRETDLRAEVRDLAERARKAEVSAAEREAYAQSLRYDCFQMVVQSLNLPWFCVYVLLSSLLSD